ncbi:MAG: ATP-binding protein, partial [Chitinophagaceae bacterium]
IPRTIQNVFLNAKLEAEFIKQTIIMSLNEEDITIDLQNYNHHLKNFEEQLADIQQYKDRSTQSLAENTVKLHLAIRHLENEKNQQSLYLSWAAAHTERQYPKLLDRKQNAEDEKEMLVQKAEVAATRFRNRAEKLRGEISVLENKLKEAKDKTDFYNAINIDQLLLLVGRKRGLETELARVQKELELLLFQYGEVSHKYEALLVGLEQGLRAFEQEKNEELLQVGQQSLNEEKALSKWLYQQTVLVRQNNNSAVAHAWGVVEHHKQLVMNERLKKESLRHQRFFENEIAELAERIAALDLSINKRQQSLTTLASQDQTFRKQWELDEARANQESQNKTQKLQDGLAALKKQILDIETKIETSEDAFYGWLNRNHEGWEQTIGKVSSEAVLFSHALAPAKTGPLNSNFYGIEINLDKIIGQVKSMADYKKELDALGADTINTQRKLQELQQIKSEQLEKLRTKYKPQLKDGKVAMSEQQFQLEKETLQLQEFRLQKKEFDLRAADEKKKAVAERDAAIAAENEGLINAEISLKTTEQEVAKQLKAKERESEKKLAAINQEATNARGAINEAILQYRAKYNNDKDQLAARQRTELEGRGADTERIASLNDRISEMQNELRQIEEHRDTVAEYKKDKRELIDKTDDFKTLRAQLEQQYSLELQKHELQKNALQQELTTANESIEYLKKQIERAEEDRALYATFLHSDAHNSIEAIYREEKKEYNTEKRPGALISEIQRSYYHALQRLDDLKEELNRFVGNFSLNNIFNFPNNLSHRQQYLDFAEQLNEFINNSKIEEFEKRVNERFADIIHLVGKETGILMSKGGEIEKVIREINKNFDNKNFVGAIRKIELRLDESSNRVVQLLLHIQRFNLEHGYELGGINLFSSVGQESKNKKAADLLKQLAKAIAEYRKEVISLSDSFELKFRIVENENDTGWVERLSSVGSEGTDVLVKAMINIMLLDVFKQGASKRFKDFRLHCMMDEIGRLHPNNVKGILQFANDRNINLINGSPIETNATDYKHIYKLEKDSNRYTRIKRIITNFGLS